MNEVATTVIGIDVGGERKGFHAVALQNGTFVATLAHSDPAVIVLGEKKRRLKRGAEFDLAGRDVIAVQSKHRRLGMTVAGQTLFSKELLKRFKPRSIRSVAVCTADDAVLRPLLERHKGCEVRVYLARQAVS